MRFIDNLKLYDGLHYPVIGDTATYTNHKYAIAYLRYVKVFKWLITVGVKVKLKDPDKPYTQYAIDTITSHPEMVLTKKYYNDMGEEVAFSDNDGVTMLWVVQTKDGLRIGDITTAHRLTNLSQFDSSGDSEMISCGFDDEESKWYGWSHRAMIGFGIGDKLFEKEYGDDHTIFTQHGRHTILTLEQAKVSAQRFAQYVSE